MAVEAERGPRARVRWLGLWDGYFVVCHLVTTALVFTSGAPQGRRVLAIGGLTVAAVWYAALGRPLLTGRGGGGRRNVVFCAGLVGVFALVACADLTGSFALFGVVPMLMMSLPVRPAVVVAVLVNLLPPVAWWLRPGAGDPPPPAAVLASLLGVALSALLGLWIKRVVRQNREHAELIEELQRNRAQVARLSHQAGIAAERERLAREIHDTLAQSLTSIIGLVQAAEAEVADAPGLDGSRRHLALAGRVARDSLAEARAFVAGRAPAPLEQSSPARAVRRQAEGLTAQTGVPVRFAVEGAEGPLPMQVGVVLLRAAQESLANVRKHAAAGRVEVTLRYGAGRVGLVVRDDGGGFAPGEAGDDAVDAADGSSAGGFGLAGLRARVAECGGVMTVVSRPGEGTVVEVHLPVPVRGVAAGAGAGTDDDA
ncbi:sensor histidine kinase [Streptomyces lydicus]|uniref:sensor histidine kinase n=1 Tax=Streptomyces lydicus TaxID=47763 RepID=UPI0036EE6DA0